MILSIKNIKGISKYKHVHLKIQTEENCLKMKNIISNQIIVPVDSISSQMDIELLSNVSTIEFSIITESKEYSFKQHINKIQCKRNEEIQLYSTKTSSPSKISIEYVVIGCCEHENTRDFTSNECLSECCIVNHYEIILKRMMETNNCFTSSENFNKLIEIFAIVQSNDISIIDIIKDSLVDIDIIRVIELFINHIKKILNGNSKTIETKQLHAYLVLIEVITEYFINTTEIKKKYDINNLIMKIHELAEILSSFKITSSLYTTVLLSFGKCISYCIPFTDELLLQVQDPMIMNKQEIYNGLFSSILTSKKEIPIEYFKHYWNQLLDNINELSTNETYLYYLYSNKELLLQLDVSTSLYAIQSFLLPQKLQQINNVFTKQTCWNSIMFASYRTFTFNC